MMQGIIKGIPVPEKPKSLEKARVIRVFKTETLYVPNELIKAVLAT